MKNSGNNYAFIDSQNLNLGIQKLGWKLDYKKFRVYPKEKYNIQKAYMFIGFDCPMSAICIWPYAAKKIL